MRILLDSDAYTCLIQGEDAVAAVVREAGEIVFSTIVVGELLRGFRLGSRFEENLRILKGFLENAYVTLVPVTWATADRYARIAESLKKKGRPIPTNDIWIAAHALETGTELISFDHHFDEIDGLIRLQPR